MEKLKRIFYLGIKTPEGVVDEIRDSKEELHELIHQKRDEIVYAGKGSENEYGKRAFEQPQFAKKET